MKIDSVFNDSLQYFLSEDRSILKKEVFKLLDNIEEEYYPILFAFFMNPNDFSIDKNNIKDYLNKIFEKEPQFINNKIHFLAAKNYSQPSYGTKDYQIWLENDYIKRDIYKDLFFSKKENINEFENFKKFNFFQDLIIDNSEIMTYKKRNYLFNIEAINNLFFEIIEVLYPSFKFSNNVSNKNYRFLKEINDVFLFGFQFNKSQNDKLLKNGKLLMPNFEIILVERETNKKSITEKNVLILNNLDINFFAPPALPLEIFFAKSTLMQVDQSTYRSRYDMIYEKLDSEKSRVYNNEDFGSELKKHIYYYLKLSRYFSASFLDYHEKCIIETINLD